MIVKITDVSCTPHVKYVFVGPVDKRVSEALSNVVKFTDQVDRLDEADHYTLVKSFGPSWESVLGLYQFHPYSGLSDPKDKPVQDPKATLQKAGISSFKSYRASLEKGLNPLLINCGRRVFGKELLSTALKFKTSVLKFVYDFPVRLDDSIKTVKRKIYLTVDQYPMYLKPEWQHIWTSDGRVLGTQMIDRSTEKPVEFEANVAKDLEQCIAGSKDSARIMTGLQNRLLKVVNYGDTILEDYLPLEQCELYMNTYIGDLSWLKSGSKQLPSIYRTSAEFFRVFLCKYFDSSDKVHILQLFDEDSSYKATNDSRTLLTPIKQQILSQESSLQLLDTAKGEAKLLSSHVQTVMAEVSQPDDFESSAVDLQDAIDLDALFEYLSVDKSLIFIAHRTKVTKDSHYVTRYKVKKDLRLLGVKMRDFKSWLNPVEQWLRKPNTLTLKFKQSGTGTELITMVLHPTTDYKLSCSYSMKDQATFSDVQSAYQLVCFFIEKRLGKLPYQTDRSSQIRIPLPILQSQRTSSNSSVLIKNMTQSFVYNCKRPFRYEDIRAISTCFFPFLSLTNEQGEISKFWKRTPKYGSVISKLIEMDLYDISKLINLPRKDWQKLNLLPNKKANEERIDEFYKYIVALAESRISFYFKRHSRYDTLNTQKRLVSDFLNSHNLSLQQVLYENVEQRGALIVELRRRLNLTVREAQDVLTNLTENTDFASKLSSRVSAGIRCDMQAYNGDIRVTVQGLKNFTPRSSLPYLLHKINWVFAKLVGLYDDSGRQFSVVHKQICDLHVISENEEMQDAATQGSELDDEDEDYYFDDFEVDKGAEEANNITSTPEISEERSFESPQATPADITHAVSELRTPTIKGSYHLSLLQGRDPYLFVKQPNWDKSFAQNCQKNQNKQPVILTEAEFKAQDRSAFTLPKGTPDGFKYRGFYYICPEIWCPNMMKALHPHQLSNQKHSYTDFDVHGNPVPKIVSGTCPTGEQAIIANDGINGWKAKGINPKDPTQGRWEYPGFLTDLHPDGIGIPCCFQTDNSASADNSEFFRLLAGETVFKKKSGRVPVDSSRRYILGVNKFPLEDLRFGDLQESLDSLFNAKPASRDPTYSSKIYHDNFRRYLRMGVTQAKGDSFVTCMARVLDIAHGSKTYQDAAQFRAYLAANLQDDVLIRSLRSGNLKLIFEDFPGDDYISKLRDYLQFDSNLDFTNLWDLMSRPLQWLIPEGLNIFIFKHDFKRSETTLLCPLGEVLNHFYQPSRRTICLFTDGTTFEPIVKVTQKMNVDPFLPERLFHKIFDTLSSTCRGVKDVTFHPTNVFNKLASSKNPSLLPVAQVVNSFNKMSYIVTKNKLPVPVETGFGPLYLESPLLPIFDVAPPIPLELWLTHVKELNRTLDADYTVIAKVADVKGNIAGVLVNAGFAVPVQLSASQANRLELSQKVKLSQDLDEALYRGTVKQDNRAINVSKYMFITETIQRLRLEVADFLQRDLTTNPDQKRPRFWLQIHSILNSFDKTGNPLPVWAKRSLLAKLFLDNRQGIVSKIITTRPSKDFSAYNPESARTLCSAQKGITAEICNSSQHCAWNNRCKLYVPDDYLDTFALIIVEDLLRNTIHKELMLENRLTTLIRNDRIDVSANQITFDDEIAPYVTYLLERFDAKKLRTENLPGLLVAVKSSYSNLRQLKEHIIYDGFLKRFVQMVEAATTRTIDIPARIAAYKENGYAASAVDIFSVVAYALSIQDTDARMSPDQVRQDVSRYIKSHNKTKAFWKEYLRSATPADIRLRKVNSLHDLCRFIEESDYAGSVVDLNICALIYPVEVEILRTTGKTKLFTSRKSQGNPRLVFLMLSEKDLRPVIRREATFPQALLFRNTQEHSSG